MALVIVLAFVVLLTGLIVAYFARSITGRQLSNSSAGQTKAALLAQSASDFVISGLKQEIVNGSTVVPYPSPVPSPAAPAIYLPSVAAYAVPVRFPLPSPNPNLAVPNDPIPNLVRTSVRDASVGGPIPPSIIALSRASAVNSTNDKAINGHIISPTRWNSHYLIPRAPAPSGTDQATADKDTTPDGWAPPPAAPTPSPSQTTVNFVPPDWVLMTRSGPAVETGIGTGATAISNPVASNQNYVVGRYAYAIYDEGGLLDMNVAGFPQTSPTPAPSTTGFTSTQIGRKGSLALADLTQLPVIRGTPASVDPVADPSEYLPQAVVNQLVGWRNNLAAGPTGSFPAFTFNTTQTSNWFNNFANSNMNGFMKVYGAPASASTYSGVTDQAFTSRQQLLHLRNSINGPITGTTPPPFNANVLQYMGTFSRNLEQPSFIPSHIRYPANNATGAQEAPNINAVASSTPPPATSADAYLGNNDQAGMSGSTSTQDLINPAFLTVRVPTTVSGGRNDGSDLIQGEPLVKRRFSLRRLAWITYKGPSASNMSDINVQQAITAMGGNPTDPTDPVYQFVAKGTAANIAKYFGLSWGVDSTPVTGGGYVWTYNHGFNYIMPLSQVAASNREPDFAELLKASINAGSLAKGGPNLNYHSGTVLNYQYTLDTALDYNVFQIMANLIDQFDTDSYPTVIEVAVQGSNPRAFRGVEDLPYFYRYHPFTVVKTLPSPLLAKTSTVKFTATSAPPAPSPTPSWTTTNTVPATGVRISNPGEAELLWAPDVWNPHDPNSTKGTTGSRPTRFRLSAITGDPIGATTPWSCSVRGHVNGEYTNVIPPKTSLPITSVTTLTDSSTYPPPAPASPTSSSFTFSDAGGTIFREPTLLWRTDAPTGANITPEGALAGPYADVNTGVSYTGIWLGKTPLAFTAPVTGYTVTIPPSTTPTPDSGNTYLFEETGALDETDTPGAGNYDQFTFRLWYQDPTNQQWVIYDEKYPDLHGLAWPTMVVNKLDWPNQEYYNTWSTATKQINDEATAYDPRIARFGIGIGGGISASNIPLLETLAAQNYNSTSTSASNVKTGLSKYTVLTTTRPGLDYGNQINYSDPCQTSDPGNALVMRWYSGKGFNASATYSSAPYWPLFFGGLLSENNPALTVPSRGQNNPLIVPVPVPIYYEDADGMARRAMGAYAHTSQPTSTALPTPAPTYTSTSYTPGLEGLPEATANSFPIANQPGVGTPFAQGQNRPLILNRPFRSVAEMSYASRGGIWKQIDFFTPESGDTGLLDVFCIDDPLPDALAAGGVNLNTHQKPVLKAVLAGAYRDEVNNYQSPTSLPYAPAAPLTAAETDLAAAKIQSITMDTADAWRGPFMNIGEIVGRYVPDSGALSAPDLYTYMANSSAGVPSPNRSYGFAGLSAALDGSVYTYTNPNSSTSAPNYKIQRMREAAIRPLADAGQTRVWNLLIDVVAQTGRYPGSAASLSQFSIDGEKRYWVHVAIDRFTGEVIDRQTEEVTE